jgi:hypothetical protein
MYPYLLIGGTFACLLFALFLLGCELARTWRTDPPGSTSHRAGRPRGRARSHRGIPEGNPNTSDADEVKSSASMS